MRVCECVCASMHSLVARNEIKRKRDLDKLWIYITLDLRRGCSLKLVNVAQLNGRRLSLT